MSWLQPILHALGNRSPAAVPSRVARELHPEMTRRLVPFLQQLKNRGWNPVVSTVPGSAYRTAVQHAQLPRGRTSVPFSAHQVTGPNGEKWSMAVHVFDPSVGLNPPPDHPFAQDVQTAAELTGLRSGRPWRNPYDPLHVQLIGAPPYPGEQGALSNLRSWVQHGSQGQPPPFAQPRLRLWAPQFNVHTLRPKHSPTLSLQTPSLRPPLSTTMQPRGTSTSLDPVRPTQDLPPMRLTQPSFDYRNLRPTTNSPEPFQPSSHSRASLGIPRLRAPASLGLGSSGPERLVLHSSLLSTGRPARSHLSFGIPALRPPMIGR
jgi:hypothetical protein